MASIHRQKGKPHWFCAYTDNHGQRRFVSTRTTDKKTAAKVAAAIEKACDLARQDSLSVERAQRLIAEAASDVLETARTNAQPALQALFQQAADLAGQGMLTRERLHEMFGKPLGRVLSDSGDTLPSDTIAAWCDRWLAQKAVENEPSTHTRYELAVRSFRTFLGSKQRRRLDTLTPDTVLAFRDQCAKALSPASVNTNLKVLRALLNGARRAGLMSTNPAGQVASLKERGEGKRRALTLKEIQAVLRVCGDTPWRGLVLCGLYTGQRLADVARLKWQQVDLLKKEIWFVTQKTGQRLAMRLAEPLAEYLSTLPSADDADAPLFPRFAEMARHVSSLSNAFALEVLIPAGLMPPREDKHVATGRGRTGKRMVNPVTFHSLRHSFVTMLKATGASEAMAQAIVGHESAAISRHYTHLSTSDTAEPISKLPDVTKAK